MVDYRILKDYDPELFGLMLKELDRQKQNLELIASENFVSLPIMAAAGSHLTNKYAEGYSGRRYYGGCEFVDEIENLAIERAKKLFGAQHANVQAHCGSSANFAAFFALLNAGDTILSMSLMDGGHLTHGSSINFSGKHYNIVNYGVSQKDERIDYNEVERLARLHKPKLILAGASSYSRIIDFKRFKEIADLVGAYFMVDMAHIAGLVVAGEHPSPVPYADVVTSTTHKTLRGPRGGLILCKSEYASAIDKAIFPGIQGGPLVHIYSAKGVAFKEAMQQSFKDYQRQIILNAKEMAQRLLDNGLELVSGGTDNHLMLIKLKKHGITGKRLEAILDQCRITVNKNAIPFDTESPFITSGIRVGTPSVTTRGMKEAQMQLIADLITDVIKNGDSATTKTKQAVEELTAQFPIYTDYLK